MDATAATSRIRLGSGSVLLNHRSPFQTAGAFQQFNALYPVCIDLGLGRATAGPVIDLALRQDRDRLGGAADQLERVREVLAWLERNSRPTTVWPGVDDGRCSRHADVWILGSSPSSVVLAADLGLPYAFAGFLSPQAVQPAPALYREHFRPSVHAREPRSIVAPNVTCAPTPRRPAAPDRAAAVYASAARGRRVARVPSPADAGTVLGGPAPLVDHGRPGVLPQHSRVIRT